MKYEYHEGKEAADKFEKMAVVCGIICRRYSGIICRTEQNAFRN
jgi:hypothetical protein